MSQQRVLGSVLFQSGHANLQIEADEIFIPFDDASICWLFQAMISRIVRMNSSSRRFRS
jgi:hypothetical protein